MMRQTVIMTLTSMVVQLMLLATVVTEVGWQQLTMRLQDNVGVTGYYGFNNKTNKSIGDNDKLPNYYRVDLNYQF